jgi:Cation transport ATPase
MKNKPWYQQTTDELFANLETQEQGLTEGAVKERREKYGENKLAAKTSNHTPTKIYCPV